MYPGGVQGIAVADAQLDGVMPFLVHGGDQVMQVLPVHAGKHPTSVVDAQKDEQGGPVRDQRRPRHDIQRHTRRELGHAGHDLRQRTVQRAADRGTVKRVAVYDGQRAEVRTQGTGFAQDIRDRFAGLAG